MLLKDLPVGSTGKILNIHNSHPEYRRRLVMLGATPGARFEVLRVAPLGDPVEIRVRSTCIALRLDEASVLEVETDRCA
ncbi:MAG: ferrous iron transport protein A [Duodenibacillus sp.]|jgi:ferrous iron transport protein A|nr:ferrous iron transport protein A [Duodenibacillus sp.]